MKSLIPLVNERAWALAKNPYTFISKELEEREAKVCDVHLLFQRTTIMKGAEAAKIFYNPEYFSRKNAAPGWVKKTLFGEAGVQGLDGKEHKSRKSALMLFMGPEAITEFIRIFESHWMMSLEKWRAQKQIVLLNEMQELLCRAVCQWTGVPLRQSEIKERTEDLCAMIEGPGRLGIEHLQARLARKRTEDWVQGLLQDIRDEMIRADEETAIYTFAHLRDANGDLLSLKAASVDLINILRPTVAIAWYIVFEALALHRHPEWMEIIHKDIEAWEEPFVHEVRRFYPFFPFVAAIAKKDFEWLGHSFKKDNRVLLDLYGTNHDPEIWDHPHIFNPGRFNGHTPGLFEFIPQGGGDPHMTHRCPGEGIVVAVMRKTLQLLTKSIDYQVPKQDLEIDFKSPPAAPKSGFIIENIAPKRDSFIIESQAQPWFITSGSISQ